MQYAFNCMPTELLFVLWQLVLVQFVLGQPIKVRFALVQFGRVCRFVAACRPRGLRVP